MVFFGGEGVFQVEEKLEEWVAHLYLCNSTRHCALAKNKLCLLLSAFLDLYFIRSNILR